MKKLKKCWNKRYRCRGALIGIIFGLLIVCVNFIFGLNNVMVGKISGVFMYPIIVFILELFKNCESFLCLLIMFPIYLGVLVFYGLIGYLIGLMIEKMKKGAK